MFHLITTFQPKGDQPNAIEKIVESIRQGQKEQVLLGATGTGKTFTMANIIQQTQKSTLIQEKLLLLGYKNDKKISPGSCQIKEDKISFMLGWEESYYFQLSVKENQVQKIEKINQQTGERIKELSKIAIPPSQDYVGEEG